MQKHRCPPHKRPDLDHEQLLQHHRGHIKCDCQARAAGHGHLIGGRSNRPPLDELLILATLLLAGQPLLPLLRWVAPARLQQGLSAGDTVTTAIASALALATTTLPIATAATAVSTHAVAVAAVAAVHAVPAIAAGRAGRAAAAASPARRRLGLPKYRRLLAVRGARPGLRRRLRHWWWHVRVTAVGCEDVGVRGGGRRVVLGDVRIHVGLELDVRPVMRLTQRLRRRLRVRQMLFRHRLRRLRDICAAPADACPAAPAASAVAVAEVSRRVGARRARHRACHDASSPRRLAAAGARRCAAVRCVRTAEAEAAVEGSSLVAAPAQAERGSAGADVPRGSARRRQP